MKKDLLMWDETLFRDVEVFEIDYMPEQFNHRDSQIRELAFHVKPGMMGARPLNTICKGLPGTGKTTTIKKLFKEIEETTKKLIPVYVNCQIDNTKFAIFSQIYKSLTNRPPPASGTSFKNLFDMVCRLIEEKNAVLLVCLDDANYLLYEKEINKVLYTLLRSHESHPGVRMGVITVISDMSVNLMQEVDVRVSSVFRPTEIYFSPYDEPEIRDILNERVKQGLYPGVITNEMLDLVVEQTMKSGDLRVGIDLLKRAALNAEMDARREIEKDDICRAYLISKNLHLSSTIKTLNAEEKKILKLMAGMAEEEKEMTSSIVFEEIKKEIKIGYTRFYEIVKKFDSMRLVNLNYREGRGRTRVITLRYEPARVIEILP
ncbi:ORC1-type DNA replication protein [Methanoplanus sp. FWC-SCC4]|uniref:ORC1-type DNA replication protein n=1 Tax=Methanochimaera problematica TaxID=2609417 RepID=A0AA97FGP2_9EURY|nr:ORC1-type DNA replication protein [Methanoplanus sp. FWC-SCC4]WOF17106.1 ORC1-type DNA replication protein [Methanoplanus sp. FWC-SCC4]